MRKPIFLLISIITLVLMSIFPAAALAQNLDELFVIDGANIFGNRIGEVEEAAKHLISRGADIRVRTISTYGTAGNLDQYEAQLEQQSPSWLSADGGLKNNLIVLIIYWNSSLQEGKTGLFYGSYFADIMDNNWLRLQTDIMNPLFRNGDYADGAIEGINEIERLIAGPGQSQTPSQATTGQSAGWLIPIIIMIVIGAILGALLFINQRKKRARQMAARQRAMIPKQAAASGINELIETAQMLEIKVDVMADKVSPEEAVSLRNGLAKAKRLIDLSSQTYSELSHSAGDPENPNLAESQLAVIEGEYQKIVDNLRQSRESIQEVEGQISGIEKAIDGFPVKVAQVNMTIEEATKKQAELKKAGFKTAYSEELVAKGRNTLMQAQQLFSQKRLNEGMKYISQAGEQIKGAVQTAEELPSIKLATETAIPVLVSRIEEVKRKIENGRVIFERLTGGYAESNWESIRGNGTEAENRINWTLDALDDAREAAGPERQEWHQALELVGKGNTWLTEAESFVKSISELEVNLLSERRNAANEIEAAQADITRAWEYINRYDEDIRESLEDDLHAAERKNELAREEIRQDKPDYFRVCKLAREANEAADKILVEARSEHEAAERLRAKAASTKRDASAKVSIARMYIDNHHLVVRSEARNYLVNAVEALRQAETALDTNSQISLALKAEFDADRAYSVAQKDVDSSTVSIPNIPAIIIPGMGTPLGSRPSWGTNRPSSSSSRPSQRKSGGGSSGWSSRSRGGSIGGGGSHRGGGSTGW
jgi:uncharacterized membrane protein YgcG